MEQNNNTFSYTYSAAQQEEVRAIREKYEPQSGTNAKMEQLRKLDASVDRAGTITGLIVGIAGVLLFGLGMYFSISLSGGYFVSGIIIGVAGMALMGLSVPINRIVVRRRREQIAPEILRLTDELMQGNGEEQ